MEQRWRTRSGHRFSTRSRDRLALDRYVLPAFGDRLLGSVTAADVSAWVAELSSRLAPASVRRVHVVLAQLLRASVDAGLLAASPADRVRLPRVEASEARFLTPGELEALADAVGTRWRALVLTLAWATLRIGEACGLRREDVDLEGGALRVARSVTEVSGQLVEGPPKTAAGRRSMTVPTSVIEELAAYLEAAGTRPYLFGSKAGRPLRPSEWRKHVWHGAVEVVGLAPLRIHDLKHFSERASDRRASRGALQRG